MDAHNRALLANVHPAGWQNPIPAGRYNLVVIGAGTAGLVTAAGAAGLGAKVALIEKHLMGGDCLNVGCVPSKTLIRAARAAHEARNAGKFGIHASDVTVNFGEVMERVRAIRAGISQHDSAQRFRELGVDVFIGSAKFAGPNRIDVGGTSLLFRHAAVCSGARAAVPDVPGLREAGYLTNETVFNLTALPPRIAMIGGGPIGCELAQALQRLGARVVLFHNKAHLLDREDGAAAAVIQQAFVREGIELKLNAKLLRVEPQGTTKTVHFDVGGAAGSVAVEAIVVAAGRAPNVEDLGLDEAGIEYDRRLGVKVDDSMRTTNPRVFAAGDVCMNWKFTHAADFAARIVIQNALFLGRKKLSVLTMPWSTFTDPEVAHVGLSERTEEERGVAIDSYVQPLDKVDRSITDGETEGFVKIHTAKGTDRIVGATIVAPHAGDLISEISVAMAGGVGLGRLASVIHPYPTVAEAIRKCGDARNRTRLTPKVKNLFSKWLAWTR